MNQRQRSISWTSSRIPLMWAGPEVRAGHVLSQAKTTARLVHSARSASARPHFTFNLGCRCTEIPLIFVEYGKIPPFDSKRAVRPGTMSPPRNLRDILSLSNRVRHSAISRRPAVSRHLFTRQIRAAFNEFASFPGESEPMPLIPANFVQVREISGRSTVGWLRLRDDW
jgi:hypothetical protein